MKVETKTDALLHCFDLWLWMAVTGEKDKDEWPGWKRNGWYLENCFADCPACEYMENKKIDCNKCIISWPKTECDGAGGLFRRWRWSETKKEKKQLALEIAILALEAL
ncbi:hypothetical protein LCGC14_1202170 [marine sediment metagenome]|uniref:Uncharacterized protein n=1 Tax=marine sediment metagenome TaxID=412755 RepID=A0A0F9PLA8_9ZZZZ